MSDRMLFPFMGLSAVLMIAVALVWPQGTGARSPGPFGHAPKRPASRAAASPASAAPSILSLAPAPSSGPAR